MRFLCVYIVTHYSPCLATSLYSPECAPSPDRYTLITVITFDPFASDAPHQCCFCYGPGLYCGLRPRRGAGKSSRQLLFIYLRTSHLVILQITVGLGGNEFRPPFVDVSANTILNFIFTGGPGNHSIAQSSFETPCEPLEGGFSSGFVPVPPGSTGVQWNLTVTNDTQGQYDHCCIAFSG